MPTLYDNFERVKNFIDENNTSYVSKTELANASYVTSSALPVIDETILPKASSTYNLGSIDYLYSNVWAGALYLNSLGNASISNSSGSIKLAGGGNNYYISSTAFYPGTNNARNLGASNAKWSYAYINNIIMDGTNLITKINNMFSYDSATGTLTITTM